MAVDRRQRPLRHGERSSLRTTPDARATVVNLLYALGVVLALIALYFFGGTVGALIEWARSPEPWWRP